MSGQSCRFPGVLVGFCPMSSRKSDKPVELSLYRVILFARDVEACAAFYSDAFGFRRIESTPSGKGWIELDAGGCRLAFHTRGSRSLSKPAPGGGPHKLVFYTADVPAMRKTLLAKGIAMGPLHADATLAFADGSDPEGHRFQISNRL